MRQLADQAGSRSRGEGETETQDEAADNEHGKVDTLALENGTDNHDYAANGDTPSSSKLVGYPGSNGCRAKTAQGHDRAHQSKFCASRVAEEVVPVGYCQGARSINLKSNAFNSFKFL